MCIRDRSVNLGDDPPPTDLEEAEAASDDSPLPTPQLIARLERTIASLHIGPLPLPEVLERYEQILPGSADRLLRLVEKQSVHRQDLERVVITGDNTRAFRGQMTTFVLLFSVVVVAGMAVLTNHVGLGAAAIIGALVTGLSLHVFSAIMRLHERAERAEVLANPLAALMSGIMPRKTGGEETHKDGEAEPDHD